MDFKSKNHHDSNRDVGKYVKHYLVISLLIAVVVHLTITNMPHLVRKIIEQYPLIGGRDEGVLRALIYFGAMYIFVIPSFAVVFHRKLKRYKPPSHKFIERVVYTVFGIIFFSAMCVFPFIFLLTDNTSNGYAGFVYKSMTGSVIGLSVIGASFSYASTLCFWLLFFSVPKMWMGNNN